ncbi:MAG TPA: WD40 repeat domain-containing protein [Bacteroidia bacterium]|jgi:WD repeat-containing protein 61|nr:WD40 repeat domain-containing protein [Bacteroidia bacterium]
MQIKALKKAGLKGHQGAVYALCPAPWPGIVFSGGADKLITAWNIREGANHPFLARFPSPIYSMCYVAEMNLLLAGTSAGSIHVIDLQQQKEIKILQLHTAPVFDIRYSWLQQSFYSTGGDGNFAISSLQDLSMLRIKKLSVAKLRQMDIRSDEKMMAIASGEGKIHLMNLITYQEELLFTAHNLGANSVRFHPDGNSLLTGGKDAYLKVWDTRQNYELLHAVPAHNYAIYSIRFNPSGNLFATASRDKTVKIWDATSFELLLRINQEKQGGHLNSVNTLYWMSEPDCLISGGDDRSVLTWDISRT